MSGLWLGGLGIDGLHDGLVLIGVIESGIIHHRFRSPSNRLGADFINDIVVVIGHVEIGWRASFRLVALFIVVIKRIEQADAEPVVVIVARDQQAWHWLTRFRRCCGSRFTRGSFRSGLVEVSVFPHRLRFLGALGGHDCGRLLTRRFRSGNRSQGPEVQTIQIVGIIHWATGRKVNSEKLLCQRLGRRLAAGTW